MATLAELEIRVDASQADTAATKLKNLSTAVDQVAKSEGASAKASKDTASNLDKLLGQIDKQTNSLKKLTAQQSALKAAQDAGKIDDSGFAKYNDIIEQNIANVQKRGNVIDQANAKELAASAKAAASNDKYTTQQMANLDKVNAAELKAYEQSLQNLDKRSAAEAKANSELLATRQKSVGQDDDSIAKRNAQTQADAAKSAKDAQKAYDQETRSLQSLQKEFAPTTAEMQRLINKQEDINKLYANNRINTNQYNDLSAAVSKQRVELEKNESVMRKSALTAGQLRQANQLLPAQFTDIVVSLQGGQKPLTVLLQQGGQLKDSFGGVGAALKGMAGYVAGLVNPLTLGAAAFAAIGVAAYQGSAEFEEYNKALILTGNSSGYTAGQLGELAQSLSKNTGSTVGAASAALVTLASNGTIAGSSFEMIATAALNMQKATGAAISDTVAQFVALGKEPVDASVKLNDSLHYLNITTLDRIQSLLDQGKEEEAAALAQSTYATAVNERAAKVKDNLGLLEKAWQGVATGAKGAWDAMLNIGRDASFDQKIKAAQTAVDQAQAQLQYTKEGGVLSFLVPDSVKKSNIDYAQGLLDTAKANLESLKTKNDLEIQSVATQSASQKIQDDAIKSGTKITAELKKQQTLAEKIADARREASEDIANKNAGLIDKGQAPLSADEQQKITDAYVKNVSPKPKKGSTGITLDDSDVNDIKNRLEQISSAYKKTFADIDNAEANGKLSSKQASDDKIAAIEKEKTEVSAAYNAQISALQTLANTQGLSASQKISLDKKIADSRSDLTKKLTDLDTDEQKITTAQTERDNKRLADLKAYKDALDDTLASMDVAQKRALQGLGQGDSLKGLSSSLNSADSDFDKQKLSLTRQAALPGTSADDQAKIKQNIADLTTFHTDQTARIVANYDQMKAAQESWSGGFQGVEAAYQNFTDSALNLNANLNQATASTFSSFSSYITSALTSGETSFKSFTTSVLSMLTELLVKMALVKAIGATIGAFSGTTAGSAGSNISDYTSSAFSSYVKQAKGGGWSGGTQFFANGGAFTNSVVSSPTAFATGSGLGVMGEAGPEAIMPLTRTSDGSLGVKAVSTTASASGMTSNTSSGGVNVYVNIASDGTSSTSTDTSGTEDFAKEIGAFVDSRYKQLMNKSLQPGGDTYKAIKAG